MFMPSFTVVFYLFSIFYEFTLSMEVKDSCCFEQAVICAKIDKN